MSCHTSNTLYFATTQYTDLFTSSRDFLPLSAGLCETRSLKDISVKLLHDKKLVA